MAKRLLTVEEAAAYLGRTKEAVQHLIAAAKLPVVKSDRRVFLDIRDLDIWIEQNKVQVKKLPVKTCEACGGAWFRELNLDRFRPWNEWSARGFEDPRVYITRMPLTGGGLPLRHALFRPRVGGVLAGHTPNAEINQFFESLACASIGRTAFGKEWLLPHEQRDGPRPYPARGSAGALCREVAALERRVGRLIAGQAGKSRKPGGRWRVPQRRPDSKANGRDWLALEVQKRGLTYDEALSPWWEPSWMPWWRRCGQENGSRHRLANSKSNAALHLISACASAGVQTMYYWPKRKIFKAAEPEGRTEQ